MLSFRSARTCQSLYETLGIPKTAKPEQIKRAYRILVKRFHPDLLFAHVDRNRVRKCGQCVLHFYDTSKKGTRRWCSMQLCGNRLKVVAYPARRRTIDRN